MWCMKCGEGVPTLATVDDPDVCVCVACQRSYYVDSANHLPVIPFSRSRESTMRSSRLGLSDKRVPKSDLNAEAEVGAEMLVESNAHALRPPHFPLKVNPKETQTPSILIGFALTLGFTVFTFGAGLIGYSLVGSTRELWRIGIPVAIAGHAFLMIGIVLQLDLHIFHQRRSAKSLDELTRHSLSKEKNNQRHQRSKLPHLMSDSFI